MSKQYFDLKYKKLLLSPKNERIVQTYLERWWLDRWYDQQFTNTQTRKLPVDLSGACKLVAQFCWVVFDFDGLVVSNTHHTYIRLRNGDIYDMNRECRDVNFMRANQINPYFYSTRLITDSKQVHGLQTWSHTLKRLLAEFKTYLMGQHPHLQPATLIVKVPCWARVNTVPYRSTGK